MAKNVIDFEEYEVKKVKDFAKKQGFKLKTNQQINDFVWMLALTKINKL